MIADRCTTLMSADGLTGLGGVGHSVPVKVERRGRGTRGTADGRGARLKARWRPPRTPVPGNPGPPHPNPATLHALVAAQFPRLDAVPARTVSKKLDPESFRV